MERRWEGVGGALSFLPERTGVARLSPPFVCTYTFGGPSIATNERGLSLFLLQLSPFDRARTEIGTLVS